MGSKELHAKGVACKSDRHNERLRRHSGNGLTNQVLCHY
uniref:Uncharacterized protein n=1 Tax=Begonia x tuberhybrida TaxID=447310 RepID=A7UAM8_9ROSI|nr:hypothetical protein [Begonia x tuberhybrida]